MDRRLKLDTELREVLQDSLGYVNIYFQPPESVKMKYDCIRYKKNTMTVLRANDQTYRTRDTYEIIIISRDVDSELPKAFQKRFPTATPGRYYMADNLHHFPFTITY